MMKQTILTPELYDYMQDVSLREHPALAALREETSKMSLAVMQISPEQGQFMQFLLRMLNAKRVLEIGTFTGYSALAMSLALPEDGHLITCDINTEWTNHAHKYWQQAHQHKKIELRIAPAKQTLDDLLNTGYAQSFDYIFIDADKTNYVNYYERSLALLAPNGIIAIDNVFWDGKVIDDNFVGGQTREIRKLNDILKHDQRVHVSLLPVADGLFLIQHKKEMVV